MTQFFIRQMADAMLDGIAATRRGDIHIQGDQKPSPEFNPVRFHFEQKAAARRRPIQGGFSPAKSRFSLVENIELRKPNDQRVKFSSLTASQAIRYISHLNSALMACDAGDVADRDSEWRITKYPRVRSMSEVRDCDRQYIDRLFGEPIIWGGYEAVRRDGHFVRTALDFSTSTIRLAAGMDGHFLEMAVKCWLHMNSEVPSDMDELAQIDQGHITTSRYSFGLDGEALDAFTGFNPQQLSGIPIIGLKQDDPDEVMLLAAAAKAFELQFGVSPLTRRKMQALPPIPVPLRELKPGVAAQVRLTVLDYKRRAQLGDAEALQVLGEATEFDHALLYGGRRVVVLHRPLGSENLMPVNTALWQLFAEMGIKLFAA